MSAQAERQPPHSIEAEQGLIGGVLLNNDAFERVSDFLKPDHFFEPIHQDIYRVIRDLVLAGKRATTATIMPFLPADADIAGITLRAYVARLCAEATTVVNAYDYGRLIYDLSVRRSILTTAENMTVRAMDAAPDESPERMLEDAERELFAISSAKRFGAGFRSFDAALTAAIERAAAAYQREGRLAGIATGLHDLDSQMGGLQESDLIIIAGRPGMGKTALATNIAFNVAKSFREAPNALGELERKDGGRVGFFSLEMSAEQLATRIMAEQTGIASSKIRRGEMTEAEFERMADHARTIGRLPLSIDETGGITVGQLAARARRLKRKKGLDLLIVDYLQLMRGTSRRSSENRVQELTEITTNLKALAKELNVPIIALSQLSRAVENREDKRPHLSDLRESGSIEQDADVVMFVYREEYYHALKQPPESDAHKYGEWAAKAEDVYGKAEIIIGKQRHGPTGTVRLQFDASLTRFSSLARAEHLPQAA